MSERDNGPEERRWLEVGVKQQHPASSGTSVAIRIRRVIPTHIHSHLSSFVSRMKVTIKSWHAIAHWRWDTGKPTQDDTDGEEDVCGICRVPYEGCCPACKMPGDDCPLSAPPLPSCSFDRIPTRIPWIVWGECSHVFHMHCLLKWIGTAASKQQCPMDRRQWGALHSTAINGLIANDPLRLVTAERTVAAPAS